MWYHGRMVHVVPFVLATVCCVSLGEPPPAAGGDVAPLRNGRNAAGAMVVVSDNAGDPSLSIKTIAPSAVAYIEHRGAYWTLSAALSQVRDYTREHGETGAIFIRYLTDPNRTPPAALRAEVGFAIEHDQPIDPPFRVALRHAEVVATMVIENRPVRVRQDYARAMAWIGQQGHQPLGPITEIHHNPMRRVHNAKEAGETRGRSGAQRIEVQFLLDTWPVGTTTEIVEREEVAIDATEPDAVSSKAVLLSSPRTAGEPTEDLPAEQNLAERFVVKEEEPTQHDVAGSGDTASEDQVATEPEPPPQPEETHAEVATAHGPATPDVIIPVGFDAIPPPETSAVVEPQVNEAESMATLFSSGRYRELAEAIMPRGRLIAESEQVWFGQVVLRIGGCARGIATVFPEAGSSMRLTGDAILARYQTVSRQFVVDPRSVPIAITTRGRNEGGNLIHDLDVLLARIGTRTIGQEDATASLLEIMMQIRRIGITRTIPGVK